MKVEHQPVLASDGRAGFFVEGWGGLVRGRLPSWFVGTARKDLLLSLSEFCLLLPQGSTSRLGGPGTSS